MAHQGEIWVVAEQRRGETARVTLELLGKARALAVEAAAELAVVILGKETGQLCRELIANGADRVYCVEHEDLEYFNPTLYSQMVAGLAEECKPRVILVGATVQGSAVSSAVAAMLGTGLTAHCSDISFGSDGRLRQVVPSLEGFYVFTSRNYPEMASVAPGVFPLLPPAGLGRGEIIMKELSEIIHKEHPAVKVVAYQKSSKPDIALEEAEVIVAGGAGVGPEGWITIEKLARLLGGVHAATRPAVDEGWTDHERLIGQSGKSVAPKLYISIGISGDPLHLSGVKEPSLFIAINKNPKAPIFKFADLGVAEDYKKILPPLMELITTDN